MIKKQNLFRILQSFAFVPFLATSFTINPNNLDLIRPEPRGASVEQYNSIQESISSSLNFLTNNYTFNQEALIEERAGMIDRYFENHGLPLAGYGKKMVEEAIKNDIDWRMLPAIAMRESTGGKFACKKVTHNPFGWGGCTIGFQSYEEAIEIVAHNLGGNNHKTAKYYEGDLYEMLDNYNGGVVPEYPDEVIAIMHKINPEA